MLSNASRRVTASTETITFSTASNDTNFLTYQAKGGQYADWTDVTEPFVFNMSVTNALYNFYVRAKDRVGNFSDSAQLILYNGAQTKISVIGNTINGTMDFTSNYSPYYLDTTLNVNGTLNIGPGVTILGRQTGSSSYYIFVYGNLNVNGTSLSPVIFRRNDITIATPWYGLQIKGPNGRFNANYLEYEGAFISAEFKMGISSGIPLFSLNNSKIHDTWPNYTSGSISCSICINSTTLADDEIATNIPVFFDHNEFYNMGVGIQLNSGGGTTSQFIFTLTNSSFHDFYHQPNPNPYGAYNVVPTEAVSMTINNNNFAVPDNGNGNCTILGGPISSTNLTQNYYGTSTTGLSRQQIGLCNGGDNTIVTYLTSPATGVGPQ